MTAPPRLHRRKEHESIGSSTDDETIYNAFFDDPALTSLRSAHRAVAEPLPRLTWHSLANIERCLKHESISRLAAVGHGGSAAVDGSVAGWSLDQNCEGMLTMHRLRVRFTVRQMMILVIFVALVSAFVIQSIRVARRDRELSRLARLLNDYRRAADRMQWAERMYKKGYVSKAVFDYEKLSLRNTGYELGLKD